MDGASAVIRKLQKYDYEYYPVWETLIKSYLKSKKLWEYCTHDYDNILFESKVEEAKFIIYSTICDQLVIEFRDCETAYNLLMGIRKVSIKPKSIHDRLGPHKLNCPNQIRMFNMMNKLPYDRSKYRWVRKIVLSPRRQKQTKKEKHDVHHQTTTTTTTKLNLEYSSDNHFVKKEKIDD